MVLALILGLGGTAVGVRPATAQEGTPAKASKQPAKVSKHSLADIYRQARLQVQLEKMLAEQGAEVPPLDPEPLATEADTLLDWLAQFYPAEPVPEPTGFEIHSMEQVEPAKRRNWANYFAETKWAYLGSNFLTELDTTYTRILRGRLQAAFGDPTRTLGELSYVRNLNLEEYIQFEYWFVLNDTIPVRVMDTNGPFDRGLVVAVDNRFRDALVELREALLGSVERGASLGVYVDYFYSRPRRRWYRTGFDGRRFFIEPIAEPNLARGRPQLSTPGG